MDNYDQYLSDLQAMIEFDQETRLAVLDAAASIEMEMMAVVVFYLAGQDPVRRQVIESQVGRWGGSDAMRRLIRTAIASHDGLTQSDESNLACIADLFQLRHLIAHGRVEAPQANHPELKDGQLGRRIAKLSRSGDLTIEWIPLDDAAQLARNALAAASTIGHRVSKFSERIAQQ